MSRTYKEHVHDLPEVEVPDWELIRRIEQLFRPYVPIKQPIGGYRLLRAEDDRGEYTASTADELEREVEAQEQPPCSIRAYVDGKTPYGEWYELGLTVDRDMSSGLYYSSSEEIVNHFATRTRELFGQAAERLLATSEPRENVAAKPAPLAKSEPSRTRPRYASVIAGHLAQIVTGVVVGVVVGLILYALVGR